ncbi:hypothetical protein E2C01_067080 [Portunus trituberculatus]|uniref:Uncharacterized protein n=1 Tax=Portunus trituberculatus TaxID=210409 RepID=A0A5B7HU29_PORTR|nr:hypothetical protein [Portunus trituberculatus]
MLWEPRFSLLLLVALKYAVPKTSLSARSQGTASQASATFSFRVAQRATGCARDSTVPPA